MSGQCRGRFDDKLGEGILQILLDFFEARLGSKLGLD